MKSPLYMLAFTLLFITNLFSQMPDYSKEVQSAMLKLSVMEGKWEGEGWKMDTDGTKKPSNIKEELNFKLDKQVLVIEGLGINDEGITVHNALGFISFNPMLKKYTMKTFISSGMSTDAEFEVIKENKSYKWWFKEPRGGTIRYNITLGENTWKEEGEYSKDGEIWSKFFEMNLKRAE